MNQGAELHQFTTIDGETLHGCLYQARVSQSDWALIMIHGVAMNFYSGPLPVFAKALAQRGYDAFCMNTRGHDWIVRSGDLTAFGGAAYEQFEDCLLDIDAVLDGLKAQGYKRFVLVGHSLGSVKAIFYQGRRQRTDVVGVISCSAPKQFYSARADEDPDFPKRMLAAEELVARGKPEELMLAPASGATGLFSARTYVSKYGVHETTDVRPHAASLECPLLTTAGSIEVPYFLKYARELTDAASSKQATCITVPGANHFYAGCESIVIDAIDAWLDKKIV